MSTRVLVTGAGRGLGLELARAALARGHRVAATVRNPDGAGGLLALRDAHPDALVIGRLDVGDEGAVDAAVGALAEALGGLDLVVNSAGVNAMTLPGARGTVALEGLTADPMLAMFRVNTVGPLLVTRAALPWLRRAERPRVVNVSSWLGSVSATTASGNYAYASSKAALNMASRLLANELAGEGVVVVAVNPGWVRTAMGGERAALSAQESATGLMDVVDRLTAADSGRFLQWDGSEHPW